MNKKIIKFDELMKAFEIQMDESQSFLNTKTGDVFYVSDEDFGYAESDYDISRIPAWQHECVELANEILNDSDELYLALPSKYDINEYRIMEKFALNYKTQEISNTLYNSIKGSGAFRRFRDALIKFGIDNEWYEYLDNTLKKMAISWCDDNDVKIIGDTK